MGSLPIKPGTRVQTACGSGTVLAYNVERDRKVLGVGFGTPDQVLVKLDEGGSVFFRPEDVRTE